MNYPSISVVIPLYNKKLSITRAVTSVLSQTVKDFELIIIDDGSDDGSGDTISSIKDSRLRIITQPNRGEGEARNVGILAARNTLIAFLDADDEWMPHFLATAIDMVARFPSAGAFATSYVSCLNGIIERYDYRGVCNNYEGELISSFFKSVTNGANIICSSAVVIPRTVFDDVGLFCKDRMTGIDQDMWIRIALKYPIAWSPIEAAIYHLSAENRHAGKKVQRDMPYAGRLENVIRKKSYPKEMTYWIKEYLVRHRLILAYVNLDHREYRDVRTLVMNTRKTRRFRARWFSLAVMGYLPNTVGKFAGRIVWAIAYKCGARY